MVRESSWSALQDQTTFSTDEVRPVGPDCAASECVVGPGCSSPTGPHPQSQIHGSTDSTTFPPRHSRRYMWTPPHCPRVPTFLPPTHHARTFLPGRSSLCLAPLALPLLPQGEGRPAGAAAVQHLVLPRTRLQGPARLGEHWGGEVRGEGKSVDICVDGPGSRARRDKASTGVRGEGGEGKWTYVWRTSVMKEGR